MGGARVHAEITGNAHFFAMSELECFEQIKELVSLLPHSNQQKAASIEPKNPKSKKNIENIIPADAKQPYDVRDIIYALSDDSKFLEVHELWAANIVIGFGRINGETIGFVANQPMYLAGVLDCDASDKAARFIRFCDAFNASTGVEAWAVVPQLVLPDLFKLADNNYADHHRFLVDGSPIVGDIYDSANSTWKTILVGGLNKGGKGYYAMDVTDPANPKGLWEFGWSNTCWDGVVSAGADCHLGYTFGRPIITKLDDGTGEGPWVIVVTSGTNNVNSPAKTGDGEGYLYVLNAATGKLISKTSNGAGSAATPSNLNQIANFVDNAVVNNTTLHVYGGDMDGNIWRFNGAGLTDVNLLGVAKDSSGNRQPITTRPELAEISGKPWVYVATGRLLGEDDLLPANSTTQSTYGIKDTLAGSPVYADLRSSLNSLTMTQVGSGITAYRTIACSVSCSSGDGWVVDLPDSGERVNIDPKLQLGTLTFASNVPSNSICDIGGYSWLNFMDYKTGLAVSTALDHAAARRLSNSLAAGVNFLRLSDGRVVVNVISTDNQPPQTFPLPVETPPPAGKRVSWREVLE